jgi:Zn-dependent protease
MLDFSEAALLARATLFIPLLLSLAVHEWAHAWTARQLGDDTAERAGRLTLNPLAHVDPIGTLLLPLLGIPFGWAKPVPIEPLRFRRDVRLRAGVALTAAAGP